MRRLPTKGWLAAALATVAVLGTGTAYAVSGNDSTASYRTVAARIGNVEETLSTTGSVDSADRADLGFGTDGTVAQLSVAVGDTVKAGQAIGKLDTTDLEAALTQAKAEYARAVAQLASDEDAQASAVSDSPSPSSPSTPSGPSTPTGNDSTSSAVTQKLLEALKKAQGEVILAQSHASQAIAAAKQALATQQAACASSASATATPTTTPTGSPTDDSSGEDCDTALAAVQQAQDLVSRAQDELARALDALGTVLSQAVGSVQGSQGQTHARTVAAEPTTPSSSDQQSSSPSNGDGQTVTAGQLASDQAKIEEAQASVIAARQNLAQATLRSTRSGKVVALDTAVGDQVTAGSTVATVVGGNAVTITAIVGESQIDSVKVGQTVRVSVPGISTRTTGKVTAVGLVADSSTGTTSYPVTVTVENPTIALPAGSRASIQIVLETAKDVVTVPTSAVTRTGSGTTATVSTWNGSTLSRKTVQLGAVGSRSVAISSGLSSGTRVVLADVDRAITGAATSVNDRGSFPFPGGGTFRPPAGGNGGPVTFSRGG
jgi:HlyD family secretion protein